LRAASVARLAARADVVFIQPFGEPRKVCERQAQIVAGKTNALERTAALTNTFSAIFTATNTVAGTTNYLDVGAATNSPPRYYRIRLVP
jgi:hypothetical protein